MTARDVRHLLGGTARRTWLTLKIVSEYGGEAPGDTLASLRTTNVAIEAFPRSANPLTLATFVVAQDDPAEALHIALHTQAPVHVIGAARRGMPVILLFRHPENAVVSLGYWEHDSLRVALKAYRLSQDRLRLL